MDLRTTNFPIVILAVFWSGLIAVVLSQTIVRRREEQQRSHPWHSTPPTTAGVEGIECPDDVGTLDVDATVSHSVQISRREQLYNRAKREMKRAETRSRHKTRSSKRERALPAPAHMSSQRRRNRRYKRGQPVHCLGQISNSNPCIDLPQSLMFHYPYGRKPSWPPLYYTRFGRPSQPSWKLIDTEVTDLLLGRLKARLRQRTKSARGRK